MVQGNVKKSKSNGRPVAAQKSKNAAKYKKAAVNDMRAKVGSTTKMPKRGNFKDEAITDKALSKVRFVDLSKSSCQNKFLRIIPTFISEL
jgi:hypothetical protein